MGNYHDFDDEFARADAREKELERQMNMKDGVSSPSNYNAGGYGYAPPPQNNYYGGYNQGGYYNGANQGGYGSMQNPNYHQATRVLVQGIFRTLSHNQLYVCRV